MIKKTKYRNADSDYSCSNTGITQDIRIGCELWVSIRGSQDPPSRVTHPCLCGVISRHRVWYSWVLPCHSKSPWAMMDGWMDGLMMKLSDKGCQPVPTGHSDIRRIWMRVCVLQDGTQSDNIGLKDLYVSKAYNMRAASLQTLWYRTSECPKI